MYDGSAVYVHNDLMLFTYVRTTWLLGVTMISITTHSQLIVEGFGSAQGPDCYG